MSVLSDELSNDPLSRGYSGMTNAEATADLNTAYRTQTRASMSGDEIFTQTDATEFAALTDHKRLAWISWCGKESIDPANAANVAFVQWVFGAGSETVGNLASGRVENITRADELGLGSVDEGDVERARS